MDDTTHLPSAASASEPQAPVERFDTGRAARRDGRGGAPRPLPLGRRHRPGESGARRRLRHRLRDRDHGRGGSIALRGHRRGRGRAGSGPRALRRTRHRVRRGERHGPAIQGQLVRPRHLLRGDRARRRAGAGGRRDRPCPAAGGDGADLLAQSRPLPARQPLPRARADRRRAGRADERELRAHDADPAAQLDRRRHPRRRGVRSIRSVRAAGGGGAQARVPASGQRALHARRLRALAGHSTAGPAAAHPRPGGPALGGPARLAGRAGEHAARARGGRAGAARAARLALDPDGRTRGAGYWLQRAQIDPEDWMRRAPVRAGFTFFQRLRRARWRLRGRDE